MPFQRPNAGTQRDEFALVAVPVFAVEDTGFT